MLKKCILKNIFNIGFVMGMGDNESLFYFLWHLIAK